MRKADYVINLLLEDDLNGTTLLFGPRRPEGAVYASVEQAVQAGSGQAGGDVRAGMAGMLDQGYAFVLQKNPRDIAVFSKRPQISAREGALERAQKTFNVDPTAIVTWKPTLTATGRQLPLQQVFVEQAAVAQQAPVAQAAPGVNFGLSAERAAGAEANGLEVAVVDKSGPAAKAGIKAGDRIVQVGPFETPSGTFGPWRVRQAADFKRAMRYMVTGHTVPVRVVRGAGEYRVAVMPDERKSAAQPGTEHLTMAEIAQARRQPSQAVQQTLRRTGGRAKDFTPNATDPASMTGNQPVNVSALT